MFFRDATPTRFSPKDSPDSADNLIDELRRVAVSQLLAHLYFEKKKVGGVGVPVKRAKASRVVKAGIAIPLATASLWLAGKAIGGSAARSADFMPHGYCYLWDPRIVWLHVISDGLITLSYYCIPLALVYLLRRRRDLPFNWIFGMFGVFILGCGTTHLMEIWTVWHAAYLLAGVVKGITAAVSVLTAVMLIPLIPKAIALPSTEQLQGMNYELRLRVVERERTEQRLQETLAARERMLAELADNKSAVEDLQQAQAAVREGQDRLNAIIQSAMDAILTVDEERRIVLFNAAAEKMFGCAANQALGGPVERFIPERFRAAHTSHIRRFSETGTTSRGMGTLGAIWGRRANGEEFPLEASISQVASGGKKLFTVILRDITERKRAEEALNESLAAREQALKEVADQKFALDQHAIVATTDVQGTITYVNDKFCAISKYPREELLGQNHRILNSGYHSKEFFQRMYRIIANGQVWRGEICNRAKDGWIYWVDTTIVPFAGEDGKPRQYVAIRADITERKRAEEALRESLATSKVALKDLADQKFALDQHAIVATTDVQGTITYVNDKFCAISKYSRQELVGQNHRILNSGHHPTEFFRQMYHTIANGEVWRDEVCNRAKDGSIYWVDTTVVPFLDAYGKPRQYMAIRADITERKQAEEVLHESQERFRLLLDGVKDYAIYMLDPEGNVISWNAGAARIKGYLQEEILGKHFSCFYTAEDRETGKPSRELQESLSKGRFEEQAWRVRKDGSAFWANVVITPMYDDGGTLRGFSKVARDITERRAAEEALQESLATSEAALKELADQNFALDQHAIVAVTDVQGTITYVNEKFCTISQYSKDELIGQNHRILNSGHHPKEFFRRIYITIANGKVWHGEIKNRAKDGSIYWVDTTIVPTLSPDGKPQQYVAIRADITERKRAEEALRESEERFQAMANGIQQLAWMAEADGHIFWYNARWYEYTGTTFEQMQGWGWQSVQDADMLPKVLEGWKSSIASGEPFDMEFPLRGADGHFRMFLTRVMPVRDSENRVVRWFGTNTEISERKQTEERLAGQAEELSRQAEELLRSQQALETQTLMLQSVLDSMQEGLVAADEQGKFIIWNPAATKILGLGATNLRSPDWTSHYGVYQEDMVTPFPADHLPLVRAIRGEASSAQMFVRNPELDQGTWIEASGGPLKDKNGAVRGGVVAFRDISQRRADEREIRKLNEELEARVAQRTAQLEVSNRELEAFTYSVSHDLRAPLRHIGGFSKILIEDFSSGMEPEARHHLQRIEEGTQRMGLLVDELLNLARVGRHSLKLQAISLNSVIDEVVSLLLPEAEGRLISWKIAKLPPATCDPILLKQVFQNLISNALKFTRSRERAVIEINHQQQSEQTVIFVRDNGVGFNMKYQDKLFGVFQRLHRAEDFEGTGIGLATVQRIIHKHAGRVWAEAELDKGATFYFTLASTVAAGAKPGGPGEPGSNDLTTKSTAAGAPQ